MPRAPITHPACRLTSILLCVVAACRVPTDADVATTTSPQLLNAPSDVSPAAGLKQPKPSFVTTACVNGSGQMEVTDTWNNQTIDPTQRLTITLTLKGARFAGDVLTTSFIGPFPQPSFGTMTLNPYKNPDGTPFTWASVSTVGAAASGAFSDVAATLRQPKSGWAAC